MQQRQKIYVIEEYRAGQGMVPLSIEMPDGRIYHIKAVVDCLNTGGGTRYTCDLGGRERQIWNICGEWYVLGDAGYTYPF